MNCHALSQVGSLFVKMFIWYCELLYLPPPPFSFPLVWRSQVIAEKKRGLKLMNPVLMGRTYSLSVLYAAYCLVADSETVLGKPNWETRKK